VKLRRSQNKNEWLLIKHRDEICGSHVECGGTWRIRSLAAARYPRLTREKAKRETSSPGFFSASAPPSYPERAKAPMPHEVSVTLAKLADKPFLPIPTGSSRLSGTEFAPWHLSRTVLCAYFSRSQRDVLRRVSRVSRSRQAICVLAPPFLTVKSSLSTKNGRSDFQKLQKTASASASPRKSSSATSPLTYYFFDVLYCNGFRCP